MAADESRKSNSGRGGDRIRRPGRPRSTGTAQDALAVEFLLFCEGDDEVPASRRDAERLVALSKLLPGEEPREVVVPPELEQVAGNLEESVRQNVKRTRERGGAGVSSAYQLSWQTEVNEIEARQRCSGCAEDSLPHFHCENCGRLVGGPNVLRGNVTLAFASDLVALVCDYDCWEELRVKQQERGAAGR